MKKLKLNINALAVESFATKEPSATTGTVVGMQMNRTEGCTNLQGDTCNGANNCYYFSYTQPCSQEYTCAPGGAAETCYQGCTAFTCRVTCAGQLGNTCYGTGESKCFETEW